MSSVGQGWDVTDYEVSVVTLPGGGGVEGYCRGRGLGSDWWSRWWRPGWKEGSKQGFVGISEKASLESARLASPPGTRTSAILFGSGWGPDLLSTDGER